MSNVNKPVNRIHPSIHALALLGPRAMIVIDRNRSIAAIAAYETTLGPKVSRFQEVRNELQELVATYKKLSNRSAAEIDGLDDVTRLWGGHVQLNTSLDREDIGITDVRSPEAILDNGRQVMQTLGKHAELSFAAQALIELEDTHSSAKAAYDATQAGRVAVQVKQRELRTVAAEVQKELVKLRSAVRIALGSTHIDFQRLRVRSTRPEAEVPDDSAPESTKAAPDGSTDQ